MSSPALHTSLRVRTNLVLACVWLAALLGVILWFGSVPWTMIGVGIISGMLQGSLQRRALRDGTAQFLTARSALEVRSALISTAAGRAQIKVLWGSFVLYLAVAFLSRGDLGPFALAPLLFSALLAQWFVRESFAVPACAELEKAGMGPAL